jgi:hypothetical protein
MHELSTITVVLVIGCLFIRLCVKVISYMETPRVSKLEKQPTNHHENI